MVEVLVAAPLLTLFLTIALGTLIGAIPFGPLRFGAAGALFVGLAIGALDPRIGEGWGIVQTIGLGLFVDTVGLASGATFFKDLRKQYPIMIGAVILLIVFAGLAAVAPHCLRWGSSSKLFSSKGSWRCDCLAYVSHLAYCKRFPSLGIAQIHQVVCPI